MTEHIVFVNNIGDAFLFKFETGKKIDIVKEIDKIVAEASKDGFSGYIHQIPEKYFKEAGISVTEIPVTLREIEKVSPKDHPITLCTCADCGAYEDGACLKYGGAVDKNETFNAEDCMHSTGGKFLCYDGTSVTDIPFYLKDDKTTPAEIYRFIMSSENDEMKQLAQEISEYLSDEEEVDETKFSFETDY